MHTCMQSFMCLFSSYIEVPTVNGSAGVHYWLVQNSEGIEDAPTVIWHQGGPGGSSMIGLMTENGPLTVNDASFETEAYNKTGIPTVFLNPYSWHTAPANVLYVEHPPPTGFSYCVGECWWNDTSHSVVNYEFLVSFFNHYPELASNPFFMSGESYAGVLVPTTALQILSHRTKANQDKAPWSLQGWAIGNACPGNRVFTCTPYSGWIGTQVALDFRFGHGMISEALYAKINKVCEGQWGTYEAPSKECATLLEDPVRPCLSVAGDTYKMGGGYFLYDTCDPDLLAIDPLTHHPRVQAINSTQSGHSNTLGVEVPPSPKPEYPANSGQYACGQERGGQVWLNIEAVREAIHVKTAKQSGRAFHWSTGLNYTLTAYSLLDTYKKILLPAFRVMQFSGDADPCVPYVGTQRWITGLGYDTLAPWRPWRVGVSGIELRVMERYV